MSVDNNVYALFPGLSTLARELKAVTRVTESSSNKLSTWNSVSVDDKIYIYIYIYYKKISILEIVFHNKFIPLIKVDQMKFIFLIQ